MQKIEAIIRPFKLEEVKANLIGMGLHGATVSEVWVNRRRNGNGQNHRSSPYREGFLPRVRLEVVVPNDRWQEATTAILRGAQTGKFEDGKIFVTEVVDSVHIRTGEHDAVDHIRNGERDTVNHIGAGEHDTVSHIGAGEREAVAV
jgi:nitrogen regulatory protein P-II 1